MLRACAASYVTTALNNISREFPSDIWHRMQSPDDLPKPPRQRTPVFYGSFDWHSCVEMHWLLVRLLRTVPDAVPHADIRRVLDQQFTVAGLEAEARFIGDPANRGRERPYGWGWALQLIAEIQDWDDADARRWAPRFELLGQTLSTNFLQWLPKATYAIRHGVHANSAFGLSRALPYADHLANQGNATLRDALSNKALNWFGADAGYPARWEPSGADFLSPALSEAELMGQLLPSDEFARWLSRFLPDLADGQPIELFAPVTVSDPGDGQIAHMHGLNASRAWCWRRIAEMLPSSDARVPVALEAMRMHAAAALPHVIGSDYMVEHWLAAYAVLLMS
jgi:hypothetical protein